MFLRQINFSPRTPRGLELARKTTDAETGIESSGFMKSRPGEYLTSRRGEVKIPHLVQGTVKCYRLLWNGATWTTIQHAGSLWATDPAKERVFLSSTQVRTLVGSLPDPCRAIVSLLALTGLRIGELLALRWKHIDRSVGVIRVRATVHEGSFGTPKTRSSRRDIPISRFARVLLEGLGNGASQDDLVFHSQNGAPVNPKNLANRVLRPACRALDLPVVGWHSFRHTHATLLGESGGSIKTAQALLGHSDVETTLNIYTHAIPDSQRVAVERVAAILDPNGLKIGNASAP